VIISVLLYEKVLGQTRLRMSVKINRQEGCTVSPHRNDYRLLEDSASKLYKYFVIEKVDHIDNVIFGVLCLAISVILNKISNKSMNHNI